MNKREAKRRATEYAVDILTGRLQIGLGDEVLLDEQGGVYPVCSEKDFKKIEAAFQEIIDMLHRRYL